MSGPRLSPLDCTCFRIRGAARRVTQIYSKHLASTGLKISQFSLLGFVTAQGPVSIGRLSDLLATDRTTLTRNLGPLLKDGLIERAQSGDKRRHELVATPAGRALFKRALPLWAAAEQEVRDVRKYMITRRRVTAVARLLVIMFFRTARILRAS